VDEAAIETWFMRRGLPHAAPSFTATSDVWTRAWPFLGVDATRVTTLIAVNLVILGLCYVAIPYGLLPAMRVGLLQAAGQPRTVVQLVARSLPMLLIITAFIFLNAEMWQVASELPNSYLVLILAGFFTMAVGSCCSRCHARPTNSPGSRRGTSASGSHSVPAHRWT